MLPGEVMIRLQSHVCCFLRGWKRAVTVFSRGLLVSTDRLVTMTAVYPDFSSLLPSLCLPNALLLYIALLESKQ